MAGAASRDDGWSRWGSHLRGDSVLRTYPRKASTASLALSRPQESIPEIREESVNHFGASSQGRVLGHPHTPSNLGQRAVISPYGIRRTPPRFRARASMAPRVGFELSAVWLTGRDVGTSNCLRRTFEVPAKARRSSLQAQELSAFSDRSASRSPSASESGDRPGPKRRIAGSRRRTGRYDL